MSESQLSPSLGLHILEDRTNLVLVGVHPEKTMQATFSVGFKNIDTCFQRVGEWATDHHLSKVPVHLSVTGKPVHYFVASAPPVPQAILQKSFRLQMKQATGEEPNNLFSLSLFKQERPDGHHEEYVVASVEKELRESLVQSARKYKVKLVSWDLDILCHAKMADFLWLKNSCNNTTRFLIVLEWDKSQLLISHPDGQVVVQSFSLGTSSFMENLVKVRAQIAKEGTEISEEDIHFPSSDEKSINQRKMEAQKAIHDVYIPFSQQVKTQLFATCNEYGISLPTHFAIVGEGASLFGIKESLSHDLGLTSLSPEPLCPSEMVVAYGTVLKEKKRQPMNFLPRGGKEQWRVFKENLVALKARIALPSSGLSSEDTPMFSTRNISIVCGILALLIAIPFVQRSHAAKQLEVIKEDNKKLISLKVDIEKAQKRESEIQKKVQAVKLLELKRPHLSRAMKEIITILPEEIKLKSVHMKSENLIVKGQASSHVEVQKLLKSAQSLHYLSEPLPIGMLQEGNATHFEIAFKMKN